MIKFMVTKLSSQYVLSFTLRNTNRPNLFYPPDSVGGPYEKELLKALLRDYEIQNRPVLNESAPLELTFGVSLQQIIDVVRNSFKHCFIKNQFVV